MAVADFRSDTLTTPTAEMREAMATAEVGDDVFGEDPTVHRLEARAAELVGMEAGLLVPSGTMANQIGVKLFTQPGDEIIAEERCHILTYEAGGIGLISGVQSRAVRGDRGRLEPADVEAAIRADDIHLPRTTLICLENSHNVAGGTITSLKRLDALREISRRHAIPLFMDGARLFNAAIASGTDAREYGERVDLLWFALSKGLSAPVGSVVCGSAERIEACRRIRKQLGGGMRQAGILAAAGLVALESGIDRLADDHRRARELARALAGLPGLQVEPVETNIVVVRPEARNAAELSTGLAEGGVRTLALADDLLRFVTHREIEDSHVELAIAGLTGLLTR